MYKPSKEALEELMDAKGLLGIVQLREMVEKLQILVDDPEHDPEELKKTVTQLRYWAGS